MSTQKRRRCRCCCRRAVSNEGEYDRLAVQAERLDEIVKEDVLLMRVGSPCLPACLSWFVPACQVCACLPACLPAMFMPACLSCPCLPACLSCLCLPVMFTPPPPHPQLCPLDESLGGRLAGSTRRRRGIQPSAISSVFGGGGLQRTCTPLASSLAM
jgi:hypothetical protein